MLARDTGLFPRRVACHGYYLLRRAGSSDSKGYKYY
jgi:hypothetical protein